LTEQRSKYDHADKMGNIFNDDFRDFIKRFNSRKKTAGRPKDLGDLENLT